MMKSILCKRNQSHLRLPTILGAVLMNPILSKENGLIFNIPGITIFLVYFIRYISDQVYLLSRLFHKKNRNEAAL